jgi:hypothetical protein
MRPWTLAIEAWRFCRPVVAIHITLTRNSIRIRINAKNLIRIRTQVKIRIWIRINNDADPQPWLDTINWFLAWWLNDRLWLFSYFLFNVQVERTRQAQSELKDQIECLSADLKRIAEEQSCPVDLGTYRIFISIRIRQCCGSDPGCYPGAWFCSIPKPGSRIPDSPTKKRGGDKN